MRFIRLDENNIVISTRIGETIVEGELESETGECGDIMQSDGSFITPEVPSFSVITMSELKENQLILMDAIATLFETIITPV